MTAADVLRRIAMHSPHAETLQRAASDLDALARTRALVDSALKQREAQPYDAMGEAPRIALSELIQALERNPS